MTSDAGPGRVLSTHSVIVDLRVVVPRLPEAGGDVLASGPTYEVGGGFNLLYAAARQGVEVAYAGSYGAGPNGDLVGAALRGLGIRLLQPAAASGDTGVCITLVSPDAERSFVTAPGVESQLQPEQLAPIAVRPGDVVAMSGYDLVYEGAGDALVKWVGRQRDRPVLLDPGPLVQDIPPRRWGDALPAVSVLSVNEREARLLTGGERLGPRTAHQAIRRAHPVRDDAWLVIRRGAAGCTVDGGPDRTSPARVPSMRVAAVDTTGAGDTHTGVFLAEVARGRDVRAALHRANVAAAMSVTLRGPATAPTAREVDTALDWQAGASVDAVWSRQPAETAADPGL